MIKEDLTEKEMAEAVQLIKKATNIFKEDSLESISSDEVSHLALYFRFIIDVAEGNISENDITQLMSMNDVTTNQQLH
jgi:hypothetical protein